MNPMVVLLILFALSSRQTAKPKRQVLSLPLPDAFDCGNVDAVATAMALHMRGTMTPEAVAWYADAKDTTSMAGLLSVMETWTYLTLSETGGTLPFPWVRDGGGPFAWTAVRDDPATLPPNCREQIQNAVAQAWAVASLSL